MRIILGETMDNKETYTEPGIRKPFRVLTDKEIQEIGKPTYDWMQDDFWRKYGDSGYFEKIELLYQLPLFKNVRHTTLPNDSRVVLDFLCVYLDDYADYIKNKEKKQRA